MENQTFMKGSDAERNQSIKVASCIFQKQKHLARGRLLWAKMDPSPWWPVQIVDERTISRNCIFNDRIKGGVLARFYGSCIYAWVDPFAEPEESFKGSNRRAFEKALEEEMLLRSKIMQSSVEPIGKPNQEKPNPENSSQHTKPVGEGLKIKICTRKRTKREELERIRNQGKEKEKVPSNEQDVMTDGSGKRTRRIKVLRHLGLAAPPDSPFNANSPLKIAT